MQIIFDSIEERDRFFDVFCVDEERWRAFGLKTGVEDRDCNPGNCRKCWEKSWLKYRVEPCVRVDISTVLDHLIAKEVAALFGVPESVLNGEEPDCTKCKYEDVHEFEESCRSCGPHMGNNFEAKEEEKKEEPERACKNCRHKHVKIDDIPCCNCSRPGHSWFEKVEVVKRCGNCKYNHLSGLKYPCRSCIDFISTTITYSKWEPKDEK